MTDPAFVRDLENYQASTLPRLLRALPSTPDAWTRADPRTQVSLLLFAAKQRSEGRSETTIRGRRSILLHLARSAGRTLTDLDLTDLRLYIGRPEIKDSSRRTIRAAIIAFYEFALEDGRITTNPAEKLGIIRVPRGQPRPFSPDQVDRMLTSGAYRRTRAMILLGYHQGFRVSQIAAVHGRDIHRDVRMIRTLAKGGKERVLPLHPAIAALADTMPTDDWWFPARRGGDGHISPRGVSDAVHDAKLRAGIHDPTLTAHSLRHSFGTELVREGVNVRVIQELMLHEDLSSTQIYTGVSEELKAEGIGRLDAREIPNHSGRQRRPSTRSRRSA